MNAFGWCRPIEDAALLHRLGFDYIECPLVSLHLEDEESYRRQLPIFLNSPIDVKAFNVFFPGDIKVVGPDVDQNRVERYVAAAADTLAAIGVSTVVLGSGRSRNIPEGWERARAEEQFLRLLQQIAERLKGTGVTLVIEPLNTKESNLINSVGQAVSFAKQINHPSIRVLADFYHMDEENEPLAALLDHRDWISHIHLADTGRLSPGTGHYPYDAFVANLKEIGYQGMISAECTVHNVEQDMAASLQFIRTKWAN